MSVTLKTRSFQELSKQLGINEKGKVQQFVDKTVADNLMPYVSFRSGEQERSIKTSLQPRKWSSTYRCRIRRISSIFKEN